MEALLEPMTLLFIVLVSVSFLLCTLSPLLYSSFVATRQRPVLPRRILFVTVVTAFSYGLFSFLSFVVGLPVQAYVVFIAPQLEFSGHYFGEPLVSAARFVLRFWWLWVGPVLLALSVVVTRYLAKRWSRIVAQLDV